MHERPQVSRLAGSPSDVADAYDRWSRQYDDDQNATRDLDAFVLRQVPLQLVDTAQRLVVVSDRSSRIDSMASASWRYLRANSTFSQRRSSSRKR